VAVELDGHTSEGGKSGMRGHANIGRRRSGDRVPCVLPSCIDHGDQGSQCDSRLTQRGESQGPLVAAVDEIALIRREPPPRRFCVRFSGFSSTVGRRDGVDALPPRNEIDLGA